MDKLFISGAGGAGRGICDIAERLNAAQNRWSEIGFIDDTKEPGTFYGRRVFPYRMFKDLFPNRDCEAVVSNGEPAARGMLYDRLKADGYRLARVVDGTAVIAGTARLGEGVVLYPFVYVSSDAQICDNVMINAHATIGHDSVIGKNSAFSANVMTGGCCRIGDNCFVGTSATIRDKTEIGAWTIVGMGSNVCGDLASGGVYMGNPAVWKRENADRTVFRHGGRAT